MKFLIAYNNNPADSAEGFFSYCGEEVLDETGNRQIENAVLTPPSLTNTLLVQNLSDCQVCVIANHGDARSIDGDNGDLVSIHYNLYNIEDKLIETNFNEEPLQFVYGNNEMVPGIEEAVGKMRVGGKATIIVPAMMGFGDIAIDKELPAYSTVIFDIELIDVQKVR